MYEPEHSILGSLAKRVVIVINTNPISQPEQSFRVLKGPFVSMRRFFFEHLKHMFKSYDVDTQKNRLDEMVCLSTKNKCSNLWIRKYSQYYAQPVFVLI